MRLRLAIVAWVIVGQTPIPPGIQRFLTANPGYHVLTVADVRDVVDRVAEPYFTPFASGDLTGDGVTDAAAVVVQNQTPMKFGVIVAHGSGDVRWVLRPQVDKIVSVEIGEGRRLYIKHCLECDSNAFVRWNGSSYEDSLWIVGDTPATFDPRSPKRPVALRANPSSGAKVIARLDECTDTRITEVLPRQPGGVRWYRVEVVVDGGAHAG